MRLTGGEIVVEYLAKQGEVRLGAGVLGPAPSPARESSSLQRASASSSGAGRTRSRSPDGTRQTAFTREHRATLRPIFEIRWVSGSVTAAVGRGDIASRSRLGGLLNFYFRRAA